MTPIDDVLEIQSEDFNEQKMAKGEFTQLASFRIGDTLRMMGAQKLFDRKESRLQRSASQSSVVSPQKITHSIISEENTEKDEEFSHSRSP